MGAVTPGGGHCRRRSISTATTGRGGLPTRTSVGRCTFTATRVGRAVDLVGLAGRCPCKRLDLRQMRLWGEVGTPRDAGLDGTSTAASSGGHRASHLAGRSYRCTTQVEAGGAATGLGGISAVPVQVVSGFCSAQLEGTLWSSFPGWGCPALGYTQEPGLYGVRVPTRSSLRHNTSWLHGSDG